METNSPATPPETTLHAIGRNFVKAVALVAAIPFMLISPRTGTAALTAIDHRTDAPADVKRRREGEATARFLQSKMTPYDWQEIVNLYQWRQIQ